MKKEVKTDNAPKAIGPYSVAIETDEFLYTSGQIPIDPAIGKLITGDIEAQTKQVMHNLQAILKAANLTFSNVIKTTIFCVDLADFSSINKIYGEFLNEPFPARSTVQVAALPLSALIEIEMIAKK
jgi:2-iminobutanoate/2-iminopropanoate deaminase